MNNDPQAWQAYESQGAGKGHGKGNPHVPEPGVTGALIVGVVLLLGLAARLRRKR